jgi:ABC-2 type transport system ATP-binding protein
MTTEKTPFSPDKDPVIDVRFVHKSFKTVHAVKGLSLKIYPGQFVALLGPNGAGKTTLVEMIEGIQRPDSGDIFIMGNRWKGHEDELHRMIGLSLQETPLMGKLTVFETLRLFASFYQLDRNRVSEIIQMIGLQEKKKSYVVNISRGQRQRLALGIALLNNPRILLLDEPTTGLDPNARREIWSILLDLKRTSQTSLILTTHYMDEAEHLCDYIVVIHKGEILKEGTLRELLEEENGQKLIEFSLEGRNPSFESLTNNSSFQIEWDHKHQKGFLALQNIETELPQFLKFIKQQKLTIKNLEFRKRTLDDLFTSMTGRRLHD